MTSGKGGAGAALRYHEATNHTDQRLRADPHELDWANRPIPFKVYRGIESVPLPADAAILEGTTPPALDALDTEPATPDQTRQRAVPDLAALTRLLYLSAGITKRKRTPAGELYFRAYSNTGALYHVDVYLVTAELPGVPSGVYHFAPETFALNRLRRGDFRALLAEAAGRHPRVARAPVTLISASTYWRNAWKYRARAYRHCFWDAGTMHANLLAVAEAEGLMPELVAGFVDRDVETLLGLDPRREGALTLVPLGDAGAEAPAAPAAEPLELATEPLSPSEVDYPLIRETQAATSLESGEQVIDWRQAAVREDADGDADPPAEGRPRRALALLPPAARPDVSLARVIRRRGSTRAFDPGASISYEALCTMLHCASRGVRADFLKAARATLLEIYLIVHAVDGLSPGTYYFDRRRHALAPLREGECRRQAGRLALGQSLAADAAVNVYSLCDVDAVVDRFGDRGYRAAQLEGGITGGRLYLGAYTLGLGATGLTFFDDEVIEFFAPHAAGSRVMFLTAIGRADRAALGIPPSGH